MQARPLNPAPRMTHDPDALRAHAQALYPAHPHLQREWLRAVDVVRTTARGWGLDAPPLRLPEPAPEVDA